MQRALNNIISSLIRPDILLDYTRYTLSKLFSKTGAILKVQGDVRLSHFVNYSEYRSIRDTLSESEMNFIRTLSATGGDIIDIGANIGSFTLFTNAILKPDHFYSFEANPHTYESLKGNIELNKTAKIEAIHAAVSDQNGSIFFRADPIARGTCSICKEDDENSISVPAIRLDDFIQSKGIQEIALLKVDVEGFEDSVFAGCKNALSTKIVKMVYYEVCPKMTIHRGKNPWKATALLQDAGYKIFKINHSGQLVEASIPDKACELENWVAIPKENA